MANLIIDIGNTVLKASWADGITLGRTFRYQGEKMLEFILSLTSKNRPDTMILSSVRVFSQDSVELMRGECERLLIVDRKMLKKYEIPLFLSPDRAASIIASRYLFKEKPCTIFDLGTTLSIDFLDRDGKYEGGNVSPGCITRFRSLNRYTKQLPLLDAPDDILEKGTNVVSSITSGVISGIVFEIEAYMNQNPENIAVFTGGDAIYFAKRMKNSIFVVCNLVLMGLALIADRYDKKD